MNNTPAELTLTKTSVVQTYRLPKNYRVEQKELLTPGSQVTITDETVTITAETFVNAGVAFHSVQKAMVPIAEQPPKEVVMPPREVTQPKFYQHIIDITREAKLEKEREAAKQCEQSALAALPGLQELIMSNAKNGHSTTTTAHVPKWLTRTWWMGWLQARPELRGFDITADARNTGAIRITWETK